MDVTRKIRALEKANDADKVQAFLVQCEEQGIDLRPWEKRLAALREQVGLQCEDTIDFIEGRMEPEEYAALWGCDPCYDHPPRQRGDGYLFYNFNVEGNDPEFLRKFIPAIERTIAECADRPGDQEALRHLKEVCEERLADTQT